VPQYLISAAVRAAATLSRHLGRLLIVLALASPAAARTYEDMTREALAQLGAADAAVSVGDAAAAGAALEGVGQSLSQLSAQALAYREKATGERDRCVANVAELDQRIGEMRTQEEDLNRQIGELDALLAGAAEKERLSQESIRNLQQQMREVEASLAERRAKLAELESWWWVPGYGAYLGIRTLADEDIQKAESLSNEIREKQSSLHSSIDQMQRDQMFRGQLDSQRRQRLGTQQQLTAMREQTAGRMGELRSMTAFLASAEVFWGKAEQLVRNRAQEKRADLELLVSMLGQDLTLTDFNAEYRPESTTLEEALIEFARSVDRRTNFLLEDATEYCGGPPR
jgi:chromosome segregation ATPase